METPLLDGIIKSAAMDMTKESGLRDIAKKILSPAAKVTPNFTQYTQNLGTEGPAALLRFARGAADRGTRDLFSLISRGAIKGGRAGTYINRAGGVLANRTYTGAAEAINADTANAINKLLMRTRLPV